MSRTITILLAGVVSALSYTGCARSQDSTLANLELKWTVPVQVAEPSGLALDFAGQFLWTVSDTTNRIYKIDFSGEVVDSLTFVGEDLEGITVDPTDSTIWVVEERRREVVHLDMVGNELSRAKVPVKKRKKNWGLEGITCDPKTGHLYVVNQKKPKRLVQLNRKLEVVAHSKLKFAKDYSGLAFENSSGLLWVLSDASQTVTKCDFSGQVLAQFTHQVDNAEGIAIDEAERLLYLISDSKSTLHVFDLP